MRKTLLFLCIICIVTMFGSCELDSFSPEIGGENGISENYAENTNNYNEVTGDKFTMTASGTLVTSIEQEITLNFTDGWVDIADGAIAGLHIYTLTDTATATQVRARGAELAYTIVSSYTSGANSYVTISLNLSVAGIPDTLELWGDAATITANGGRKLLNQDGNSISGEPSDDEIRYFPVGTGTAGAPTIVVSGQARNPQTTLAGNFDALAGYANLATSLTATLDDTQSSYNLTATMIAGCYALHKFTPTGWTAVSMTAPTYDATNGLYQVTVPVMSTNEIYRLTRNYYNFVESQAVAGYVHRGSYDQYVDNVYTAESVGGNARTFSGRAFHYYTYAASLLTLTAGSATRINLSSVTLSNIKVRIKHDVDDSGSNTDWEYFDIYPNSVRQDNNNVIVLIFSDPLSINNPTTGASGYNTPTFSVEIAPGIVDDLTTEDTTDDVYFFNFSDDEFGIQKYGEANMSIN